MSNEEVEKENQGIDFIILGKSISFFLGVMKLTAIALVVMVLLTLLVLTTALAIKILKEDILSFSFIC